MPPNRIKTEPELIKPPVLGLSNSCPNSDTFSRALLEVKMEMDMDLDLNLVDQLSSSCFSALKMDNRSAIEDDDLRPLSWLHSTDLLRDLDLDDEDDDGQSKENEDNGEGMMIPYNNMSANQGDPMDPKRHINSKPPFSFSCLIFMAIEDCIHKRLPVKDIYQWIQDHFPYFRTAPTGWKNSVRHNLSLNKCFRKVDKMKGQTIGKGSLWCVDPEYRPNLLQALRKTPYHPYHHVLPYTPHHVMHIGGPLSNIQCHPNNRLPTVLSAYTNGFPIPGHIPLVERLLNGQQGYVPPTNTNGVSSETEVDAAATMMMFRTPPEKRVSEHARLKRESCPPHPVIHMNGGFHIQAHAPLQERPLQPQFRPTLSDLAETALASTGLHKARIATTPLSKAALQSKCTPQPIASEDHTYSLSTCLKRSKPDNNNFSDDDPLEVDMSEDDFSDEDMEQDAESRRLGDSGYVHDASFDMDEKKYKVSQTKKVHLPIKKRPPRHNDVVSPDVMSDKDLADGADALLNLAGIKTEMVPLRSISPESISPASR